MQLLEYIVHILLVHILKSNLSKFSRFKR